MNLIFKFQFFFLILFFSNGLFAQTASSDGISFIADDARIQKDGKYQKIFLQKRVQAIYRGQNLSGDKAIIDTKNKTITASGNVVLTSVDASVKCEKLIINYETNQGEIFNGFVQVGQITFEGEKIIRVGEKEYETISGKYSACKNCPPSWSISGTKVSAEIGGYAYISNSVIKFSDIPILWLPYLIVPIKSERQTGLLFPSFSYSDASGNMIADSVFWAISDNTDATLTGKSYAKRGFKTLLNYRFVQSKESRGSFDFGYMKDRVFTGYLIEKSGYPSTTPTIDRWYTKYHHHYELPYNFTHNLDINYTSDTLYTRDFPDEIDGRGDPALENRMSITKNYEKTHFSIDASYYRNLLESRDNSVLPPQSAPLKRNNNSIHRFPEITVSKAPARLLDSDLIYNLELNYTNFSRDNFSYDQLDSNGNIVTQQTGSYNSATDIIRTGQRLRLTPSLNAPVKIGKILDILPTVSLDSTIYNFSISNIPVAYRNFAKTELAVTTDFSKIYGDLDAARGVRYKHIITPEISYSYIPWIDNPYHPFFQQIPDSSASFGSAFPNYKIDQPVTDFDPLQFDYNDRIFGRNLLTAGISNKLIRKRFRYEGADPEYKQIILFKIYQSYDFFEASNVTINNLRGTIQPWSEITGLLDIRFDHFETNALIKYYPYQANTITSTRAKIFDDRGNYIQATYSKDFIVSTIPQSLQISAATEDLGIGAGIVSKYVNFDGLSNFNLRTNGFDAYKFRIKLKPPGDCWFIYFTKEQQKISDPIINYYIGFLFDGKTETNFGI